MFGRLWCNTIRHNNGVDDHLVHLDRSIIDHGCDRRIDSCRAHS